MGPILGLVPSGWVWTARLLHPGELDRRSSSSSSTHRLGLLHIIGFFPGRNSGLDCEPHPGSLSIRNGGSLSVDEAQPTQEAAPARFGQGLSLTAELLGAVAKIAGPRRRRRCKLILELALVAEVEGYEVLREELEEEVIPPWCLDWLDQRLGRVTIKNEGDFSVAVVVEGTRNRRLTDLFTVDDGKRPRRFGAQGIAAFHATRAQRSPDNRQAGRQPTIQHERLDHPWLSQLTDLKHWISKRRDCNVECQNGQVGLARR